MSTELTTTEQPVTATVMGFDDPKSFAHMQRVAKVFTSSALAPEAFRGEANLGNAIIAMNMARRMGADPMAVMQNIYIVHGKPAWSSQFVIACINSCGRYSPLRFTVTGTGDAKTCVAWAVEKAGGERLDGPPVSIGMARAEGWLTKSGSKWKTMEDLMLRYRAATFFGRLYAPEILMGMQSVEEVVDVASVTVERAAAPVFEALPARTSKQAAVAASEPTAEGGLNPAKALRGLLKQDGVTEETFLSWWRAAGGPESAAEVKTIEEAVTVSSESLRKCMDEWVNAVGMMKGGAV